MGTPTGLAKQVIFQASAGETTRQVYNRVVGAVKLDTFDTDKYTRERQTTS